MSVICPIAGLWCHTQFQRLNRQFLPGMVSPRSFQSILLHINPLILLSLRHHLFRCGKLDNLYSFLQHSLYLSMPAGISFIVRRYTIVTLPLSPASRYAVRAASMAVLPPPMITILFTDTSSCVPALPKKETAAVQSYLPGLNPQCQEALRVALLFL